MILKKVKMYGFKSFADKVEVDFSEGITGIVGPNGCGKSNVAEAIRWVLGEQSAKSLRGSSMQDVIFAGTDTRKSLSYCEVSLVFDNTKRIFPIEFDELVITRKLYRSGESEYLINNTVCRLRDIIDKIKDTGIGKDGYSIIGQGEVVKLVDSKPIERRAIFEEATGISKYKDRKTKAESDLRKTRDNLVRLNDIILEMEKRRTPLMEQAAVAKEYLKFRDELKMHEINNYLFHYENNSEAIDAVNAKLKAIAEEISYKNAEIAESDDSYARKLDELNDLDAYSVRLRDEQTALMVEAQKMIGAGELHTERMRGMRQEKERLLKTIEDNKELLLEKKDELEGLIEYNNENMHDLKSAEEESAELEKKYLELVDEILSREKEIEESNKAILATMEELSSIKADTSKLKAERDSLITRKAEVEAEIAADKAVIEEQESEKQEIHAAIVLNESSKNKLSERRARLAEKINEQKFEINTLIEETRKLNGSLRGIEEKMKILESYKSRYEGFAPAVKRVMQDKKDNPVLDSKVMGVIADIIKVPSQYETAIDIALGNAVQNIVTKNEEDGKYLIEYIKRNGYGRVTVLPMTSFKSRDLEVEYRSALRERGCVGIASELVDYDPRFATIVSGLLGRTVIAEDVDSAIAIARKFRYAFRIVTLDGEVLNPNGSMTGGSNKKNDAANLLSQERAIKEAKELYTKYKFSFDKKSTRLEVLKKENEALLEELKDVEDDLKDAEIAYAREVEKENKVQQKIDDTLKELSGLSELLKNIELKLKLICDNLLIVDRQEENIANKRYSSDDDIEKNKRLFTNKKEERELIERERADIRVAIASIEKELESTKANIGRLNKEIGELEHSNVEMNSEVIAIDVKMKRAEEDFNNAVVNEDDKAKNEEIKGRIAAVDERKRVIQQEMTDILSKKDEMTRELTSINERRIKEENQLEKIDANMLQMQSHIKEEYELEYDECKQYKLVDYDINAGVSEINRLKKAIGKLGHVNVNAIEEFKEVDEVYTAKSATRDDLETAEKDLLKLIADLSRDMIKQFGENFAVINEHFKMIFLELFGGGKAELVLDTSTSSDPLEAGIQILAQPPGTSLPNITLLSGGQKTLVSISILFAILRSKKTPFSVLDEVEAALDDSNAKLVAKYLKKFAMDTQFVVITHKKPTMEMADRLFGVTMEEKGVSKMVSVQLKEAITQAKS